MISESGFLFEDGPRVRRRFSGGGRGLGPSKHDEKGNDGYEKIIYQLPLPRCLCYRSVTFDSSSLGSNLHVVCSSDYSSKLFLCFQGFPVPFHKSAFDL